MPSFNQIYEETETLYLMCDALLKNLTAEYVASLNAKEEERAKILGRYLIKNGNLNALSKPIEKYIDILKQHCNADEVSDREKIARLTAIITMHNKYGELRDASIKLNKLYINFNNINNANQNDSAVASGAQVDHAKQNHQLPCSAAKPMTDEIKKSSVSDNDDGLTQSKPNALINSEKADAKTSPVLPPDNANEKTMASGIKKKKRKKTKNKKQCAKNNPKLNAANAEPTKSQASAMAQPGEKMNHDNTSSDFKLTRRLSAESFFRTRTDNDLNLSSEEPAKVPIDALRARFKNIFRK